jgi:hypothetical protein
VADTEVVSTRIAEIALRLDDLDAIVCRVSTDRIGRSVGQAVVDDDDPVRAVLQTHRSDARQVSVSARPFQFKTTIQTEGG